jgi:protein-tyrosine phosphatase
MKLTKVLFICLGNICRSPTAHAVFRHKAKQSGLNVEIESAGTSAYHVGSKPDSRSIKAGAKRSYEFSGIASRQVIKEDFEYYDHILAMDTSNLKDLLAICPDEFKHKVALFLDHSPEFAEQQEVPDPYYGGSAGFEFVLDLVEDASDGLVQHILNNNT